MYSGVRSSKLFNCFQSLLYNSSQFEQLTILSTSPLKATLKTYTSAMQHWDESCERHTEQIRMVLTEPLNDFMQTDFK